MSSSTRIQKKNFEKRFLRPLKIENTKKFVKKTMKVMLNFSKFLQNRVFQVFLRGYTCFLSKKSDMQKSLFRPVVRTRDLLGPTVYSTHSDPKGRRFEPPVETNFFAYLIFFDKKHVYPRKNT